MVWPLQRPDFDSRVPPTLFLLVGLTLLHAAASLRVCLMQGRSSASSGLLRVTQRGCLDCHVFVRLLVQNHEIDSTFDLPESLYRSPSFTEGVCGGTPQKTANVVLPENVKSLIHRTASFLQAARTQLIGGRSCGGNICSIVALPPLFKDMNGLIKKIDFKFPRPVPHACSFRASGS
jgi:hypothetical protein